MGKTTRDHGKQQKSIQNSGEILSIVCNRSRARQNGLKNILKQQTILQVIVRKATQLIENAAKQLLQKPNKSRQTREILCNGERIKSYFFTTNTEITQKVKQ